MKKGKIVVLALMIALFVSTPFTTFAAPVDSRSVAEINSNENSSTYTKDVIEYIYRYTDDGILQYRRWNATKGVWVDPAWITID